MTTTDIPFTYPLHDCKFCFYHNIQEFCLKMVELSILILTDIVWGKVFSSTFYQRDAVLAQ